ncbi:hypothetical protein CEXT_163731 [Caerostris extrusa]|uniref:Uncharacterized protein n=1 Tax=Caerostris extrusa TaxID=172846 RepID=A0AAV4SJ85_CAEEX|nr:hypothetical protein CEXT_163731 [Caerostris extrusa]
MHGNLDNIHVKPLVGQKREQCTISVLFSRNGGPQSGVADESRNIYIELDRTKTDQCPFWRPSSLLKREDGVE